MRIKSVHHRGIVFILFLNAKSIVYKTENRLHILHIMYSVYVVCIHFIEPSIVKNIIEVSRIWESFLMSMKFYIINVIINKFKLFFISICIDKNLLPNSVQVWTGYSELYLKYSEFHNVPSYNIHLRWIKNYYFQWYSLENTITINWYKIKENQNKRSWWHFWMIKTTIICYACIFCFNVENILIQWFLHFNKWNALYSCGYCIVSDMSPKSFWYHCPVIKVNLKQKENRFFDQNVHWKE